MGMTKFLYNMRKGLFSSSFELIVQPKKSDIGCSKRSQPCEPLFNDYVEVSQNGF